MESEVQCRKIPVSGREGIPNLEKNFWGDRVWEMTWLIKNAKNFRVQLQFVPGNFSTFSLAFDGLKKSFSFCRSSLPEVRTQC
jgi:hypothetical protein